MMHSGDIIKLTFNNITFLFAILNGLFLVLDLEFKFLLLLQQLLFILNLTFLYIKSLLSWEFLKTLYLLIHIIYVVFKTPPIIFQCFDNRIRVIFDPSYFICGLY